MPRFGKSRAPKRVRDAHSLKKAVDRVCTAHDKIFKQSLEVEYINNFVYAQDEPAALFEEKYVLVAHKASEHSEVDYCYQMYALLTNDSDEVQVEPITLASSSIDAVIESFLHCKLAEIIESITMQKANEEVIDA